MRDLPLPWAWRSRATRGGDARPGTGGRAGTKQAVAPAALSVMSIWRAVLIAAFHFRAGPGDAGKAVIMRMQRRCCGYAQGHKRVPRHCGIGALGPLKNF